MGHSVTHSQLVAGQLEEEAVNLLPESRWWHWIVYPVVWVLVALLLGAAVVVVSSG